MRFSTIEFEIMKKKIIICFVVAAGAFCAFEISQRDKTIDTDKTTIEYRWLETDSAAAIDSRLRADFSLSREQITELIQAKYNDVTDADIDTFVARHYIEAKTIDGEQRFHRKSVRNLGLLNPEYNGGFEHRGDDATQDRINFVDSILQYYRGKNSKGLSHEVTYRFSINVPYNEAIAGDTLRVWMPLPLESDACVRQRNVEVLEATPADYTLAAGRSIHNSIYFEAPAPAEGDTAHFEYTGRYINSGAYASAEQIAKDMKPYDKESDIYKTYTKLPDGRHIVPMEELAREIVGDETNPFKQSELVFDYIINRYPWAGAREYSTIECIPEYVIRELHGDCGQVSLLYISLMRSLGVPARWESGWMLHPGEVNLHDWSEVYFEGIGWVPVDISFGRYTGAKDPEITYFYSHGMDSHRMAVNKGVGCKFYPEKRFVRSETVDFQTGEVETTKGNLYYPAWDYSMDIIKVVPISENFKK